MRAQASLGNLKGAISGHVANRGPLSLVCPFLNTHDSSFEMPAWWGWDALAVDIAVATIIWLRKTLHDKNKVSIPKVPVRILPALLSDPSW